MDEFTILVSNVTVSTVPVSGTFNISVSGNLLSQNFEYVDTPARQPSFSDSFVLLVDGVKKASFLITGEETDEQIASMKINVLKMIYRQFLH